jgi:hypothetical protein
MTLPFFRLLIILRPLLLIPFPIFFDLQVSYNK